MSGKLHSPAALPPGMST